MSENLGSACQAAALPFATPQFPSNAGRRPFAVSTPRFQHSAASLKHSVFASTFMLAYVAAFFGVGYAAMTAVVWAWSAIVR